MMATAVVMPRLGWTMETGQVVEWRKREGERVEAGEILMLVESDKAINEVEALESGVLQFPPDAPAIGDAVPIGTVLAYLTAPGEAMPAATADATPVAVAANVAAVTAESQAAPVRERRRGPVASPRARRVARELGVSWESLRGSGISGRILERDVRAAAPAAASPAPVLARPSTVVAAGQEDGAAARSATRRTIAERMLASAQQSAPVTLTTEADATELARLRGQLAGDLAGAGQQVPAYHDFILRLTALALQEHPALNASLDDGGIVEHEAVNIGLAVDTPRGLLVPVVRDVPGKSVQRLASESAALIAAAQAGTLAGDAMRGGTFTISNLGMYGIDAFTPLINLPECAILGLGRIVARPVVTDEERETVAVRRMMTLSLTFDHRLVDGAPAARFLQRVVQLIERPLLWLTR
jgi:pyruvate dehydrogenase E2 component (dihydrolipoamide acetyltransferase)